MAQEDQDNEPGWDPEPTPTEEGQESVQVQDRQVLVAPIMGDVVRLDRDTVYCGGEAPMADWSGMVKYPTRISTGQYRSTNLKTMAISEKERIASFVPTRLLRVGNSSSLALNAMST